VADQLNPYLDFAGRPIVDQPQAVRAGVCAAIFDSDGRLLMERRSDNGFWGMPGGGVDVGESVEQAVKREVMEETGLRVEIKRLVGVYSDPRRYNIAAYPDGIVLQGVSFLFECVRVGGDLRISHESTEIGYFGVDDLPENMLLSHVIRIADATDSASGPFIR
jgi:ADP-ribose pyrophosphatase YjhB (NUDIX family)